MAIQTPIRGLRSFCVAAKCLSFKHAASQLFLTPSAVSHQIKQLEDQLGTSLFQRNTRAIELTSAGKQFYQKVYPLITELETTIADFTNTQQNKTITISLPEFFASEIFVLRRKTPSEAPRHDHLSTEPTYSNVVICPFSSELCILN